MLSDDQHQIVLQALQTTFGSAAHGDLQPLHGGMSGAYIYRVAVAGRPYVVRLVGDGPRANPAREFACMQAAADAGIAPRVYYASSAERIAIMDLVEPRPYPADAVPLLAPLLARLHALPPFADHIDMLAAITRFVAQFDAAKVALAAGELFDAFAQVAAAYPRGEWAACHDDLKHANVLFDGERFWLVDWEAAFGNDRYFDLAVAGNFFVRGDAGRFLATYLGAPPDAVQRARALAMRVAVHASYVAMFGKLGAARTAIDPAPELRSFREFHDLMITGGIDTSDPAAQIRYAKVHLAEGLRVARSPEFATALRVLA